MGRIELLPLQSSNDTLRKTNVSAGKKLRKRNFPIQTDFTWEFNQFLSAGQKKEILM